MSEPPVPEECSLFVYDRAVRATDVCFEAGVLGSRNEALWEITFAAWEPLLVCAPAVQGKSTYLRSVELHWNQATPRRYHVVPLTPPAEACRDAGSMADFIVTELQARSNVVDISDLLESSELLRGNADRGIWTLLLFDASRCHDDTVSHWLVHNFFKLAHEYRDLVRERGLQVILTGDYDVAMLAAGPQPLYPLTRVRLRNFSRLETIELCRHVSRECQIDFGPEAGERVVSETQGDKYFVNFLAAHSVACAIRDRDSHVVTESDVIETAAKIRQRELVDPRVGKRLEHMIEVLPSTDLRRILDLVTGSPWTWDELSARLQRVLFQFGVVGPVEEARELHGTASTFLAPAYQTPASAIRYGIRNPMVAEYLYHMLGNAIGRPHTSVKGMDETQVEETAPSVEPDTPADRIRRAEERMRRDRSWFETHREDLIEAYGTVFVAVYHEKVLDRHRDRAKLLKRIRIEYGPMSFYLGDLGTSPHDDESSLGLEVD